MNLRDICGKLINKFATIFRLSTNQPEYKLVFRHFGNVLMCPGGYSTVDIGIGSLKYKTNFHAFLLPANMLSRLFRILNHYDWLLHMEQIQVSG